jgi:DNA-3-methyladenine glycosylase II
LSLLAIPHPYDFALSTERFRAFGDDLATRWVDGALHKVLAGREVRIAPAPGGVELEPADAAVEAAARTLLGLPFDLAAFAAFVATEPSLAAVAAALAGYRPPLVPDPFEMLVTSITAQQVSLHSARAIRNRLLEAHGERHDHAYAFPSAEQLARLAEDDLLACGFSLRKAEYVLGLARCGLDLDGLASLPDDAVRAELTRVRGLGDWTADWFLARHLARPHAWPAGDLAVRKAVSALYADGRFLSIEEVRAVAPRFAPFENLSIHYLLTGMRVLG